MKNADNHSDHNTWPIGELSYTESLFYDNQL